MTVGVAVKGAATCLEFADEHVFTPAVSRSFVSMTPVVKEEPVSGRLGEAELVALGSQEDPKISLLLKASFAALSLME